VILGFRPKRNKGEFFTPSVCCLSSTSLSLCAYAKKSKNDLKRADILFSEFVIYELLSLETNGFYDLPYFHFSKKKLSKANNGAVTKIKNISLSKTSPKSLSKKFGQQVEINFLSSLS